MNLDNIVTSIKNVFISDDKIRHAQTNLGQNILEILINNGYHNAIIAGGAPRNWSEKRPANDIDIYIVSDIHKIPLKYRPSRNTSNDVLTAICNNRHLMVEIGDGHLGTESTYDGDLDESVINNVHSFKAQGQKIQIIELNLDEYSGAVELCENCVTPGHTNDSGINKCSKCLALTVFNTFDFGICKVAINRHGIWYKHEDFVTDFKNKTLTIRTSNLESMPGLNRLQKRLDKMRKYYPDFKVAFNSDKKLGLARWYGELEDIDLALEDMLG